MGGCADRPADGNTVFDAVVRIYEETASRRLVPSFRDAVAVTVLFLVEIEYRSALSASHLDRAGWFKIAGSGLLTRSLFYVLSPA